MHGDSHRVPAKLQLSSGGQLLDQMLQQQESWEIAGKLSRFGNLVLTVGKKVGTMEQVGVVYVAFGAPYLAMALTSALSLRAYNAKAPMCVVTNVCKDPPNLPWWNMAESHWTFVDEVTPRNRLVKTDVYGYSPFKKSLYLDCDTLVLSDISLISFLLNHFDVLLKHSDGPGISSDAKKVLFNRTVPFGDVVHFNGGVIGFRKGKNVEEFFDCWRTRFQALGFRRDQPALVEAVYESNVRLLPLQSRWNSGDPWYSNKTARGDVAIWHYKVNMDRYLESFLLRVSHSIFADPNDLHDVEVFIRKRRKARGYARTPKWLLNALITGMRGPLSKLPQKHVGEESWKRLLAL